MKDKAIRCLKNTCSKLDVDNFFNAHDLRHVVSAVRLFSCVNEDKAQKLLKKTESKFMDDQTVLSLSYYLSAAKELGFTKNNMEEYIDLLEDQRKDGTWSNQIWLNSLVLKVLGRYGISYPKMTDFLLEERLPNGSWYEKVWVSSYALQGLFYSHAEPSEISLTADFIKNALKNDHWEKEKTEKGWLQEEKVTSLALESLLLVGEGYQEEPIRSSIKWVIDSINRCEDEKKMTSLSVPLTYIVKGRAQKETKYNKVEPVHFRETKVEVAEQIKGTKIDGDYVNGDKVDEKLAEGSTQLKDSVAVRSNIGDEGGAKLEDSVSVRSDIGGEGETEIDSSVIRRVKESKIDLPTNYCVFNGEEIDGEIKYCPKCGMEVQEDWKHCPGCGYDISDIKKIFG